MKKSVIPYLACPECQSALELIADPSQAGADEVESGELKCSGCAKSHPIIKHVPRFVGSENYADSFGYQWNKFSVTQLDENLGMSLSQDRFKNETNWPQRLDGELILEAGSGMGRFTRCAAETGALVFSFDYSTAIDANYSNNKVFANVHFFQADIRKPPFRKGQFDRVFCFGVLQHTPNPKESFQSLMSMAKPGGAIVADVYRKTWKTYFWGQYYLRVITTRIPPRKLFPIVKVYFEIVHWLTGLFLPLSSHFSKILSIVLGTADYRGLYPLEAKVMKEWCLLDTFDKLSPAFDQPQRIEDVETWIDRGLVSKAVVKPGYNGIEIHIDKKPVQ